MTKDLIDLVKQDHREIARLLDQLDRYRHRRPMLRPVLSALLVAHDRAEEDVVYPPARDAGDVEGIGRGQREHLRTEDLLVNLGRVDPAGIGLADFADLAENDLADLLRKLADE